MTAVTDLVARSGELKQELLRFAQRPRFAKALRTALRGVGDDPAEEGTVINALDFFILQHRLADGLTVVDHFVAARPDLPERERQMLLDWRDVVEGLFEVQRRDGEALLLVNLIDELTYRAHSNVGTAVFSQMPRRSFVITRLVPVGPEWLLSGSQSILPSSARHEVARMAAQLASERPALVFRNPEKLKRGWELQRQDRARFIEFFGADLVVLPGPQLAERMEAYWQHCTRQITADPSYPAKAGAWAGMSPAAPDLDLPPDLAGAQTVGVIYDEVEGLNFYADFGQVAEAFANPEIVTKQPAYRRKVQSYLRDDSVSPLPIRRLAERDPAKASRLFQLVLKRPTFSWQADGEALLRRRKRDFFDKPALPSVTPISGIISEHYRAAASDRAPRQTRASRRLSRGKLLSKTRPGWAGGYHLSTHIQSLRL